MKKVSANNPSSTFYWKDYENDEGLRVSSLAAQGLWMRLMCVAAKSDPYGYVLINGKDIGATGVARLGSITKDEATKLLDELERNGVFSRDRKGRIFSRRMVREAATRKKSQENGKKGGNPALSPSHGKQKENVRPLNPPLNQGGLHGGSPLTLTLTQSTTDVVDYKMRGEDRIGHPKVDEAPREIFLREKILKALDADPISGQLGPTRRIGSTADMAEVARWLSLPGITEEVVAQEVQRIADANPTNKPRSFRYFTPVFQQLSGALSAPPLEPSQPNPSPPPPGQQRATPPPVRNTINPEDYDAKGRRIRPSGSQGRPE